MKAVRIHEVGGPDVLTVEDVDVPQLRENDILVRVHTTAVNPVDALVRTGQLRFPEHRFPRILGWDLAGTVVDTGTSDTSLRVGDKVYARPALNRDGAYAELIAVDAEEVAPAPISIPLEHAASLPLVTLTAWKSLFDLGGLTAGQRVLIHAGAGGVGSVAIQLAKHAGAHVVTTASRDGIALASSLGADEVVDYRSADFVERGRVFDVVLDAVGGETLTRSYDVVVPGGHLITIAGAPDEDRAVQAEIAVHTFVLDSNGPRLAEIAKLVDAGEIRPVVSTQLPLADAAEAHRLIELRRTRGKIVLRVS